MAAFVWRRAQLLARKAQRSYGSPRSCAHAVALGRECSHIFPRMPQLDKPEPQFCLSPFMCGWPFRRRRTVEWQYRKILLNEHVRSGDDIELLCAAGKQGWELIAITPNSVAYLRRAIEDRPTV